MEQSDQKLTENLATKNEPKKQQNFWIETLKFAFIASLIILPFRYFIAQPFIVSGDSMDPTFEDGEYLIVDEITYRFDEPKRGDVIILKYPLNLKKYFIKRIIGLPGETLEIRGSVITVIPKDGDAITLDEPYIQFKKNDYIEITLSDSEYFVMGDNRAASSDSRVWGPLPSEDIVGRPILRLLPISRIDIFPGKQSE